MCLYLARHIVSPALFVVSPIHTLVLSVSLAHHCLSLNCCLSLNRCLSVSLILLSYYFSRSCCLSHSFSNYLTHLGISSLSRSLTLSDTLSLSLSLTLSLSHGLSLTRFVSLLRLLVALSCQCDPMFSLLLVLLVLSSRSLVFSVSHTYTVSFYLCLSHSSLSLSHCFTRCLSHSLPL